MENSSGGIDNHSFQIGYSTSGEPEYILDNADAQRGTIYNELDQPRDRLRKVLERTSDAIFILDHEWRFSYLNSRAEHLLRWARADLVPQHALDALPAASGTAFHTKCLWAAEFGSAVEFVEYYPPFDSWFEVQAFPDGSELHVYLRDVTHVRRIEQELRQVEERFTRFFHLTPIPAALISGIDSCFVDVNDAFVSSCGYAREELIGHSGLDLGFCMEPEERERLIQSIQEQGSVQGLKATVRVKNGETRSVECSVEPVVVRGKPCLLSIVVDVTQRDVCERKLAERAAFQATLLRQLTTVQEAERRRLSLELHDGPLQSIGVSLLALERSMRRRERGEEALADAELGAVRASLVGSVADVRAILADMSVEVLGSLGLEAALRRHIERFSRMADINVTFRYNISKWLSRELELMLYRLAQEALSNARKHAQARNITVFLTLDESDAVVRMVVTDDGRGFDLARVLLQPEDGERIGLRSMYERLHAIGGDLTVTTGPDQGTSLEFWCPTEAPQLPPQV